MAKIITTCFTDLKGYTKMVDTSGINDLKSLIKEHDMVGKALILVNKGQYRKNIGDSHMGTFPDFEHALNFATEFQQYYKKQPCVQNKKLVFRVGLCTGAVTEWGNEVFGSSVNKAKRIESIAVPGSVVVNKTLRKEIDNTWGVRKANKYFESLGKHTLKGIRSKQEIFKFKWDAYAKDPNYDGLANRVYTCLEDAGTVVTNLSAEWLKRPGYIIWPVVPRERVTAIHRGQIEIIRLLTLIGWKIHLLIADCGAIINPDTRMAESFKEAILKHARSRNIGGIKHSYLSRYFHNEQKKVIEEFRELTTELKVQDLIDINQKQYDKYVRKEINTNSTLDFLRPVLTCSAVMHLYKKFKTANTKTIIIAGFDEKNQWHRLTERSPKHLGTIYNPLLETKNKKTARQSGIWPVWLSKKDLIDDIKKTNAGKWVFQLFAQLPSFPSSTVFLNDNSVPSKKWPDEFKIPEHIKVEELIDHVWPILNPAH